MVVVTSVATTIPDPPYYHFKLRRIMSHPGNDEIIDNARDNRIALSQKMVFAATEMGIEIVQEIAIETLKRKPGMSVKEFTKVLDQYLEKQRSMQQN
tara:strand:+ start:512 stop:802 length:291 start_codon:yes stop_codon:yes gene_type:complete